MSTPSITPSFQIYQFSWIQLNTLCAPPKNFFLYRLDFWQLKIIGARILYLAEFNFIGLFDNMEWCWRFSTNIYQDEYPKKTSCIDAAAVRNRIYIF